jgi:hypothetical protein
MLENPDVQEYLEACADDPADFSATLINQATQIFVTKEAKAYHGFLKGKFYEAGKM